MTSSNRRQFLTVSVATSTVGTAGCLRLVGGGSAEDDTSTEDATVATTTDSQESVPRDASFEFEYVDGSLTIRHAGGEAVPADQLVIRDSNGNESRWHELGSTAVVASSEVSRGETATIDSSVLNWPSDVSRTVTVKLLFVSEEGSPTTLSTFQPEQSGESNGTEEPTEPGEETTAPGEMLFRDEFEDGTVEDTWDVTEYHDVESVTEEGGVLTYSSPIDETIYESDMTVLTRDTLPADGTHVVEVTHRMDEYRGMPILRLKTSDGENLIRLSEQAHNNRFHVDVHHGPENRERIRLDDSITTTEWTKYRMTIDFDANAVRSVSRGGVTYDLDESFERTVSRYRIGIGEGNGVDEYEYVRVRRL